MKNRSIVGLAFFVGVIFLIGCTQNNGTQDSSLQNINGNAVNTEVAGSNSQGVSLTGETKEFEIIAKSWEFVPSTIRVNLGDVVELHVESADVPHGFMLPSFGINEYLSPGDDVHIEFVADKRGTFPFACSIPCGSGHGRMTGELIVE